MSLVVINFPIIMIIISNLPTLNWPSNTWMTSPLRSWKMMQSSWEFPHLSILSDPPVLCYSKTTCLRAAWPFVFRDPIASSGGYNSGWLFLSAASVPLTRWAHFQGCAQSHLCQVLFVFTLSALGFFTAVTSFLLSCGEQGAVSMAMCGLPTGSGRLSSLGTQASVVAAQRLSGCGSAARAPASATGPCFITVSCFTAFFLAFSLFSSSEFPIVSWGIFHYCTLTS